MDASIQSGQRVATIMSRKEAELVRYVLADMADCVNYPEDESDLMRKLAEDLQTVLQGFEAQDREV